MVAVGKRIDEINCAALSGDQAAALLRQAVAKVGLDRLPTLVAEPELIR